MGWPKIPTDEQRADAIGVLAELNKSYPVIRSKEFFDRRDCADGFYEVTRAEIAKLLRDVYAQGRRDGAGEMAANLSTHFAKCATEKHQNAKDAGTERTQAYCRGRAESFSEAVTTVAATLATMTRGGRQ